jgi:hypothetical protein
MKNPPSTPAQLRYTIERLEQELASFREQLKAAEVACTHEWTDLAPSVRVVPAYEAPAQDQIGPRPFMVQVDEKRFTVYRRKCCKCKKEEQTEQTQTETRVITKPKW